MSYNYVFLIGLVEEGAERRFLHHCPTRTRSYNVVLGWGWERSGEAAARSHQPQPSTTLYTRVLALGGEGGRSEAPLPPSFPPRAKYSCINWLGRRSEGAERRFASPSLNQFIYEYLISPAGKVGRSEARLRRFASPTLTAMVISMFRFEESVWSGRSFAPPTKTFLQVETR